MNKKASLGVLGLGLLCGLAGHATAETITVGPTGDYATIGAAVKVAGHFDEVLVQPGVYPETVNPRGKRIAIRSMNGAMETIIDGQGTRRCLVCAKGETSETIVEGFTLENGHAPGGSSGGAVSIRGAAPRIVSCRIINSTTGVRSGYYHDHGAGIAVDIGFPTFVECDIAGNTASGLGGGAYCENFSGVSFEACTFETNMAQKGGAVYLADSSEAVFESCQFTGNAASFYGGAVYALDDCEASFNACHLVANSTTIGGGGLYGQCSQFIVSHGVIEACSAGMGGGVNMNCGQATFINVAFRNNAATDGDDIRVASVDGKPLADVSVLGCFFCGSVDPIEGPWEDLGDNVFYGACDDGACCSNDICAIIDEATCTLLGGEFRGVGTFCETEDCEVPCPADINDDGFVGADDILAVISEWGPCP